MAQLETFIAAHFGNFSQVLHEIISPDIHADLALIPPSELRPYQTVVTMGMGAYNMPLPSELAPYRLENAELCVRLAADWPVQSSERRHGWPLAWLKYIARLPLSARGWVGQHHTFQNNAQWSAFSEDCAMSAILLYTPHTSGGVGRTAPYKSPYAE